MWNLSSVKEYNEDFDKIDRYEDPCLYTERGERFILYKKHKNDKVWWLDFIDQVGRNEFTFDKEKVYSLWKDYPDNLTEEEKELFDSENMFWKEVKGE